jgi:ribosomal protein L40E
MGNTAAIYEHLLDSDAEEEYLRKDGLSKPEKQVDGFGMISCAYCGAENPTDAKSCFYCLVPLKPDEAEKFLKQQEIMDVLSDKEIVGQFMDFLRNLKKPEEQK